MSPSAREEVFDKVILTNAKALARKYGARIGEVDRAIHTLIEADQGRGLRSKRIDLDDPAQLKPLKGKAVTDAADAAQNKAAVDAVFNALRPDYALLLGSVDVIPHQPLLNPARFAAGDPDSTADGDLPYACEGGFSTDITSFTGPTRVVGRLPDLTGATTPDYLLDLLAVAASARPASRDEYLPHFGITAHQWRGSTALSLQSLFGAGAELHRAPKEGPDWSRPVFGRRTHFINCHGAPAAPFFYGQDGKDFPNAVSAAALRGSVVEGSVIAAECCYGAELYAPSLAGGQAGICNTYLGEKAYGFLGSSTTAYGPAETNGSADLLCQFFLAKVLTGASLGRALLEARQQFVVAAGPLSIFDLKTLAQFHLMGDPSIQPVQKPAGDRVIPFAMKRLPGASEATVTREVRRDRLLRAGLAIQNTVRHADPSKRSRPSSQIRKILEEEARAAGADGVKVSSYAIPQLPRRALGPLGARAMAASVAPEAMHVAMGVTHDPSTSNAPIAQLMAVVATETSSGLVVRRLFSK